MEILPLDDGGMLFLASDIDDWPAIEALGISVIYDLDGDLDIGVPTIPNHILYIYFPFYDVDLPDPGKLHALAQLGATLVKGGYKVLCHCMLGLNRSALVTGLILMYLGMTGEAAVKHLQSKKPGALYNETFANYLRSARPMAGLGLIREADL